MANSDKLIGTAITDRTVERTYGAFRIDYDDPRPITEISGLSDDTEPEDHYGGTVTNPPEDYPGHKAKSGYRRKVVCENAASRDLVISDLESSGIDHSSPEDVSPTAEEKRAIEDWGAMGGLEAVEAIAWAESLESASSIADLKKVQRGKDPLGSRPDFSPPKRAPRQ